jgi:hypothetical protein
MATSSVLNQANYTTVWDDNFATDKSLDWGRWNDFWGNAGDLKFANGALTIGSYASEGWAPLGFMQAPTGPAAGQGYGLYSVTASADAGQGVGICIVMWPADNNWPGAEIDLVESWDKSAHVQTTVHWAGAGNSNQQDIHQENVDISVPHTYAMDWEAGSLTFYIDGVQQWTTTQNVPKDYAHGGINETFGAEVTNAGWDGVSSQVQLHLYDMSYSKLTGSAPAPTTPATPPASPPATPATHVPATLSAGTGADQMVLKLSEDAYNGDAQYTVKVDGTQVGGIFTAAALHGAGDDTLTLSGKWGSGAHTVTVNFLNDAWGGTATTDRNLYVDGISYNGHAAGTTKGDLMAAGPVDFSVAATTAVTTPMAHSPVSLVAGTGSDSLVLKISEDAYNGDAQYTVKVDGVQIGGTFTAAALHGAADDTLTLSGNWGTAAHTVVVNFLNDAWGGSATTDRNLYVDAITYDGHAATIGSTTGALMSSGAVNFAVAASTGSGTIGSGSTTPVANGVPAPSNGGVLVQGDATHSQLFGSASGNDVFVAGTGGNDGMTGNGHGVESYVWGAGDGHGWINNFNSGTDHLVLEGTSAAAVSAKFATFYGNGGMNVTYDAAGDSVFLAGVWKLAATDIVFA